MSCFWGHKWGQWKVVDVEKFKVDSPRDCWIAQIQKRICIKCNKEEHDEIF